MNYPFNWVCVFQKYWGLFQLFLYRHTRRGPLTIRATPRFSNDSLLNIGKSASSPKAKPNNEDNPKAFCAFRRITSGSVSPIVASPSVRKMIMGTRWGEGVRPVDEDACEDGFSNWAADSRAALMFVPGVRRKTLLQYFLHNWIFTVAVYSLP